jgi:hypothetical protein
MLSAAAVATQRQRDLTPHAGIGIGDHTGEQIDRAGITRIGQRQDGDAPLSCISDIQPFFEIVEVIVGFERIGHDSPQQIRNIDTHSTGRAIRFAGHAIPAFIVGHVGLACHFADP